MRRLEHNIKKDLKEFYGFKGQYGVDNYFILVEQYGIIGTEIEDPTRFMIMYKGQLAKNGFDGF
jgi:hypothetical protein